MRIHLNRKRICKAIEDDVSIESIKEYYGFEITQISQIPRNSSLPQTENHDIPQFHVFKNPQKSSLLTK